MTPKFLSLEFHLKFFPALLLSCLRPNKGSAGTGFSPALDRMLFLAICIILVITGLPGAMDKKSWFGWALTAIGLAGLVFLFIQSISSQWGEKPSYESFLAGFFFFFVTLGLTAGVFIGTLNHSLLLGLLVGSSGLVTGYLLGILAGLWLQYLGWIAIILNLISGLAIIGLIVVDLVLLYGNLF